jgi:hypothetical protein
MSSFDSYRPCLRMNYEGPGPISDILDSAGNDFLIIGRAIIIPIEDVNSEELKDIIERFEKARTLICQHYKLEKIPEIYGSVCSHVDNGNVYIPRY